MRVGVGRAVHDLSERAAVAAAGVLALLWYPLMHFYVYHSSIGNVPRFMDGAFAVVAAFGFAALGLAFVTRYGRRLPSQAMWMVLAFASFIAAAGMWSLVHFVFGVGVQASPQLLLYNGRVLLNYGLLFFVGFYLRPERWRRLFALLFMAVAVNAVAFTRWDRLMVDLRGILDPQYAGIYLSLARTALFTGLFTWAAVRGRAARTAVLVVMLPVILLMGGRADVAASVLVFPVALWLTLSAGRQALLYAMLAGVAGGILALLGSDVLSATRHAQFFSIGEMTSLIARTGLLETGLDRILASPLLGDYGGTLVVYGSIGSYIHNLLSVWQSFGLFPFLLYLWLLGSTTLASVGLLLHRGRKMSRRGQLAVILSLVALIQVAVAKSFGWAEVALAWGAMAGVMTHRREGACPRSLASTEHPCLD